jgi:multidrug efflux pump subunit AcrA (membrane-fusion protein)
MQLNHMQLMDIFRSKKIVVASLGVLILVLAISRFLKKDQPEGMLWVPVEKGEFVVELVESGEIRSVNSQYVKAPNIWWGEPQIIEMVLEGTNVNKGDFLAQFDTSDMEKELLNRKESLATREAELKALDISQERRYAELESNRTSSGYSKELAELRKELMQFESPLVQRQADLQYERQMLMLDEEETRIKNQKIIDAAERGRLLRDLEHNKRWVDSIEQRIKEMTLYAPAGGMVVYFETGGHGAPRRKVAVGDRVYPGQTIIYIPERTQMQMVARVNEVDASEINVGSTVNLTLDAFEKAHYTGTVVSIAKLADRRNYRSQLKDFEVAIDIAAPDSLLKPGITAKGVIVLSRKENVVYAPIGAVFEKKDGSPVVFKRKSPDKPTPVILGKRNDRFVMIGEGAQSGEYVSLVPPVEGEYYPLGRAGEMERRIKELEQLKATPDSLLEAAAKEKAGGQANTPAAGNEQLQRGERTRNEGQTQQGGSENRTPSGEQSTRGARGEGSAPRESGARPSGRN